MSLAFKGRYNNYKYNSCDKIPSEIPIVSFIMTSRIGGAFRRLHSILHRKLKQVMLQEYQLSLSNSFCSKSDSQSVSRLLKLLTVDSSSPPDYSFVEHDANTPLRVNLKLKMAIVTKKLMASGVEEKTAKTPRGEYRTSACK